MGSKILIIGATGYMGKYLVKASLAAGHPTFALVRDLTLTSNNPSKSQMIADFQNSGVNLLRGDINDQESMVNAMKQVDVVISAVGAAQVPDQVKIIDAIKQAGDIKRFLPSEFGNDFDRVQAVGPAQEEYAAKLRVRRAVEAAGIPYTYICSNYLDGYLLWTFCEPEATPPPKDKAFIVGDGNPKAYFNKEEDVATYTIKAADDPRTLNKIVYVNCPSNKYSLNELVSLWEKKTGKKLERMYMPEKQLLKHVKEAPTAPTSLTLSRNHCVFVKGVQTNFEIDQSVGFDATELYPDVKYTTVDEYLSEHNLTLPFTRGVNFKELLLDSLKLVGESRNGGEEQDSDHRRYWYIGKYIVEASAKLGHPTFALIRESALENPSKSQIIQNFKNSGVTLLRGDIYDRRSLINAIKQVDVVISTVGRDLLADQTSIIAAIKEAGNIKRFFPSEFGNDVDRVHAVEPSKTMYDTKAHIRRIVEAEGIPYTYVVNNFFAGHFLKNLSQPGATAPPREKVVILGDGNQQAVFNKEEDIAAYTIKAVDDPRTLNKILYISPPQNTISFNVLVALWEKKIGKTLEKIYVPEDLVLQNIKEAPFPVNVVLSICYTAYVKGDHTNFEIESSFGVEASQLYPGVEYTTVDEMLNELV